MLSKSKTILLISAFLWVSACSQSGKEQKQAEGGKPLSTEKPVYARGFRIERFADHTEAVVLDPWKEGQVLAVYKLYPKNEGKIPDGGLGVPADGVCSLSTTFTGMFDKLGLNGHVKAVAHGASILNPSIKKQLADGGTIDIGSESGLQAEKLISLPVDFFMAYPTQTEDYKKLRELGLNFVFNAEYMETHPLGRAEWIKFVALFFGKEAEAARVFEESAKAYQKLADMAAKSAEKPQVFSEKPYKGQWWAPGGNSFAAAFLKDAGGDYLWAANPEKGTVQLDFESVYAKAAGAAFWNFIYYDPQPLSYPSLLQEEARFADFMAFKEKNILACNVFNSDLFGQGLVEPHIVLADFVKHFHPELLPGHVPVYFKKLDDRP